MNVDEIQNIIDYAYPKIQSYYGKGKKPIPSIELHRDIYARLSGDPEARGEASETSKAEYDCDEDNCPNKIYVYYPNVESEEDLLRSLVHEYTHYLQEDLPSLKKTYTQAYDYDSNPFEIEAHSAEEDWHLFSQK